MEWNYYHLYYQKLYFPLLGNILTNNCQSRRCNSRHGLIFINHIISCRYRVEWRDREGYTLQESSPRGSLCHPLCHHTDVVNFHPTSACIIASTGAGEGWESCVLIQGETKMTRKSYSQCYETSQLISILQRTHFSINITFHNRHTLT